MINHSYFRAKASLSRSAVDLIKYVSIDIYNRIGFVHKYSSDNRLNKLGEETLTENMVYELLKFEIEFKKFKLLHLFESKREDVNGADLLLEIPVGEGYIKVPFQAKKISPYADRKNGRYKSFHHSNSNGVQSTLLKEFAERVGSFLPIYLLYNFTSDSPNTEPGEPECFYGCSYMNINLLPSAHERGTVKFSNLHPKLAFPFYKLFERPSAGGGSDDDNGGGTSPRDPNERGDSELRRIFELFGVIEPADELLAKVHIYNKDEIFGDTENWQEVYGNETRDQKKSKKYNDLEFRPRYRLVLLNEPSVRQETELDFTFISGGGKILGDDNLTEERFLINSRDEAFENNDAVLC